MESHLSGVVISHEHGDHVRSLGSLLRRETCDVYASHGTFAEIGRPSAGVTISSHQAITIGELRVTPVPVSHDANEPFGFMLEAGDETVAIFTDLGVATSDVADCLRDATTAIIESNYCDLMLADSHYPPVIKRRISSPRGHLSNDDCAGLLYAAAGAKTRAIWLAHLSENNNRPDLAVDTVGAALDGRLAAATINPLPRSHSLVLE